MSLRNRRSRERRQRLLQGLGHTAKWLLFFAALAAVGLFATHTAREDAREDLERLAAERDTAQTEAQSRIAEAERLARETEAARAEAATARGRYAAEVPTGRLAALLAAVRARLDSGLPEDRLAEVIRDAAPRRACDGPPIMRRFRITPGERALPEDAATFFEGLVRIQANAPAGFEALSRTMVVTFAGQGLAAPVTLTGTPAVQAFRIGHHEATITVTASPVAGFAAATVAACRPD
jgi:multidrug efflux pump subunit AcrA (membrane-fusion protein)